MSPTGRAVECRSFARLRRWEYNMKMKSRESFEDGMKGYPVAGFWSWMCPVLGFCCSGFRNITN
jgi:hypothetical protein